jgi:hypothetical protein
MIVDGQLSVDQNECVRSLHCSPSKKEVRVLDCWKRPLKENNITKPVAKVSFQEACKNLDMCDSTVQVRLIVMAMNLVMWVTLCLVQPQHCFPVHSYFRLSCQTFRVLSLFLFPDDAFIAT